MLHHTWARFLAQYRYCTDGTPKNFVQKNLYQRYQVRTEGTHGKTFLADLQLVRTDGTNGKKIRADLPLVRTNGTNEKIFLKKVYQQYKMEKFSQFLPKNDQKMAIIGQKWSKKLYCWYTQKFCAKKSVPLVHSLIECGKKVYCWYIF